MDESTDIDDVVNEVLIEHVKQRPSIYYTDAYTASDEQHWAEIQKETGIQKSWLKRRWKTIRNEHRKIVAYNHVHSKKIAPHKMAHLLNFLAVDLNGLHRMNFDDLRHEKEVAFIVTQDMIDDCDISESVTMDSISFPKAPKVIIDSVLHSYHIHEGIHEDKVDKEGKCDESRTNRSIKNEKANIHNDAIHNEAAYEGVRQEANLSAKLRANQETAKAAVVGEAIINNQEHERDEDTIFGELVVAMLKKLSPEEKKQAKKEIMNVLL